MHDLSISVRARLSLQSLWRTAQKPSHDEEEANCAIIDNDANASLIKERKCGSKQAGAGRRIERQTKRNE
jgi:hypothetical protein